MTYTYQKTIEYKFDSDFVNNLLDNQYFFSYGALVDENGNEVSEEVEQDINNKIKYILIENGVIGQDQKVEVFVASGLITQTYQQKLPLIAYARWIEDVTIENDGSATKTTKLFLE
jgi:hypothetical protein